ncbi:MAG: hypothetical protein ACI9W2_001748, partial [Gammaproteobacteria bacterium]
MAKDPTAMTEDPTAMAGAGVSPMRNIGLRETYE